MLGVTDLCQDPRGLFGLRLDSVPFWTQLVMHVSNLPISTLELCAVSSHHTVSYYNYYKDATTPPL